MKPLRWTKAVVRRLANSIQAGLKFFVGHGKTNSHDGRTSVGEVLASTVKEINGKLSNIVVGYFPNESDVAKMDVCSIEASVDVDDVTNFVEDVNDVSAIALGASAVDSPAFPGATRLASLQCFEEDDKKSKSGEEKEMAITFRDVQDFVKNNNVFAHQLYSVDDLKIDNEFRTLFTDLETKDKELEALNKKLEESEKTNKEIDAKAKLAVAKDRFDKLVPENLTQKQKGFINARFKAEAVADMTDDEIKSYIENERKEFAETAKLFGVTESEQSGNSETVEDKDTGDEGDSSPEEAALKLVGVG